MVALTAGDSAELQGIGGGTTKTIGRLSLW